MFFFHLFSSFFLFFCGLLHGCLAVSSHGSHAIPSIYLKKTFAIYQKVVYNYVMKTNVKKKEEPQKKKARRPSKYKAEVHPQIAKALAVKGFTEKEIAQVIGIAETNFYIWKKEHPEFRQALEEGKADPDEIVAKRLFERATGLEIEERVYEPKIDPNTGKRTNRMEVVRKVKKEVPPDIGAAKMWLINRRPDLWRDKQDIEHSGMLEYKVIPDTIPEEGKE